ncbi:MAG: hypothetical protein QW735_02180 [archaeon]
MKVYFLGSPLTETKIFKIIQKIEIPVVHYVPGEELPDGEDLIFIDFAKNIKKAMLIEGLATLEKNSSYSPHDYGIYEELKAKQLLGNLKKVYFIALPFNIDEEIAKEEIKSFLFLISKNDLRKKNKGHKL